MKHMKNRVVLVGALLATGLVVMGAPIDGKWTVEVPGRGGGAATTQTLTLTSSGMKLTGKLDPGNGMAADISEGMVMDAKVSFKVTTMGRDGMPQITDYTGTLAGDELTLTRMREGGAPGGGGGGGGAKGGGGGGGGGGRGGAMPLVFKRAK